MRSFVDALVRPCRRRRLPRKDPGLGTWSRLELDVDLGSDGGDGMATLTREETELRAQLALRTDVRGLTASLYIGLTAIYGASDALSLEFDDVVVWRN